MQYDNNSRPLLAFRFAIFILLIGTATVRESTAQLTVSSAPSALPGWAVVGQSYDFAYDPKNQVYLVVTTDSLFVTGIFADSAGRPISSPFTIHANPLLPGTNSHPRVVHSPHLSDGAGGLGAFLVTWTSGGRLMRFTVHETIGTRVVAYPMGNASDMKVVHTLGSPQVFGNQAVAYSETSRTFLSVRTDVTGDAAQALDLTRTPLGPIEPISSGFVEDLVWNPERDEFCLFQVLTIAGDSHLVLSFFDGSGAPLRSRTITTLAAVPEFEATFALSPRTGNYVAVWVIGYGQPLDADLFAAEIDAQGDTIALGLVARRVGLSHMTMGSSRGSGTFLITGNCEPAAAAPLTVCALELNQHGELIQGVTQLLAPGFWPGDGPILRFNPRPRDRPGSSGWLVAFSSTGAFTFPVDTASANGGPPGASLNASCQTPDPFASSGGGVCVGRDWLPVSHPEAPGTPTPPMPAPGGCTTPDPFSSLGGGACVNGNWLPPGHPSLPGTTPPPTPPPVPPAGGCTTPDPFTTLGGGTCVGGNWLPPGYPGTTPPSPPPPPSPSTCSGVDPFASLATLIGRCVNGDWIPVPAVKTNGTVQFFAIGSGVWVIEGVDGTLYEPAGAFDAAFLTAGLSVRVEAELVPAGTPTVPQAIVISIRTIVLHVPAP